MVTLCARHVDLWFNMFYESFPAILLGCVKYKFVDLRMEKKKMSFVSSCKIYLFWSIQCFRAFLCIFDPVWNCNVLAEA